MFRYWPGGTALRRSKRRQRRDRTGVPNSVWLLLEMIEQASDGAPEAEAWYVGVAHAALDYYFNNRRQPGHRTYRGVRHETRGPHQLAARLIGVFRSMGRQALDRVVVFIIDETQRIEVNRARRRTG